MYLVQTKSRWDANANLRSMAQEHGSPALREVPWAWPAERVIRRNVEWLLEHLYTPDIKLGSRYKGEGAVLPSGERIWLDGEPINWGSLGVTTCEESGDHWHIVLEEAAPDSYNLCRYVQEWMAAWGWDCDVRAEW